MEWKDVGVSDASGKLSNRLAELYHRVLDLSDSDRETALMYARKYGEAVCRELGAGRGDGTVSRSRSLEDLLRELTSKNAISRELVPHLRTIQNYGNASAHEHADGPVKLTDDDVRPCIDAVVALHARILAIRSQNQLAAQIAMPGRESEVRVASSKLTVVRAIELGWNLDAELRRLGMATTLLSYPWSDRILNDLSEGSLDLAIYNKIRADKAIKHRSAPIASLGCFGYSMGGRNFYLLARACSPWACAPRGTLLASLRDVTIAVPFSSDIIENVELVLGGSQQELASRGIRFVNIPANAGLEIFHLGNDILVSAGQNLRMLARFTGGYEEIARFDTLPEPIREELALRAENCLVASEPFARKLAAVGVTDLFERLQRNFLAAWHDPKREADLLRDLSSLIDLDGITIDLAERMSRTILFETYRIGRL